MKKKILAFVLPLLALPLVSCGGGGNKPTSTPSPTSEVPPVTSIPPTSVVPPTTELPSLEGLRYQFCDVSKSITNAGFAPEVAPVITDLKPLFDETEGSIVTAVTMDSATSFIYKASNSQDLPVKLGKSKVKPSSFTLTTSAEVTKVAIGFAAWDKVLASASTITVNTIEHTPAKDGAFNGGALEYEEIVFEITASTSISFSFAERALISHITLALA